MGFVSFVKKSSSDEWAVTNKKKQLLGDIVYSARLKRWCFYPDQMCFEKDIWFTSDCLQIITDKLSGLDANCVNKKSSEVKE